MSILFLNQVSKSFKTSSGDFYALKDVSLCFNNAGFVAITGKSGSGKSTLLNIILGIEKPTSGRVIYKSKNLAKFTESKLSKYRNKDIGVIFQHYNLFDDLSAVDNIVIPALINGESKSSALKRAKEYLSKFKLDYLADQKVQKLSGGEKQRIAVIRALINDPSIILCDEPTGALDGENGRFIMDILKEISKDKLVLIVSHDKKLVDEYCSQIITLEDGKVISNETKEKGTPLLTNNTSKVKHNNSWIDIFTRIHFKKNIVKNLLTLFSTTFGLIATMVAIGFNDGIEKTSEQAVQNNLAITNASISKKEFIDIENSPLQYEKSLRPENEEIAFVYQFIPSIVVSPNITYFVPYSPVIKYDNNPLNGVTFIPIYEHELMDDYCDVIINDKALELLNKSKDEAIDELLQFAYSVSPSIQTGEVDNPILKDNVDLNLSLRIVSVVEEFSFLNTPKIYYSYRLFMDYISTIKLTNFSEYYDKEITAIDYILNSANDSQASSYSLMLFVQDESDIDTLFLLKEKLDRDKASVRIESTVYSIKETYVTFMTSFSSSLNIFILISFVGVSFILGITSLSSFISNKKESAILTILGAKNNQIIKIFSSESLLIVIISLILSFSLSIPVQLLVNNIVYNKAQIPNIINIPYQSFLGYPYLLPIGITLITILVSLVFILTPLLIYKHISLSNELKDE